MKCYLVDIDGTLADISHRIPHIQQKPKNWDAFFAATKDDRPIPHMIGLVGHMWLTAYIVFVSGRPERTRAATEKWLRDHGAHHAVAPIALYMRSDGDRRDDNIIKFELLQRIKADGWEPIMAFDDRDRVVKMWRENGIPCAQVAPGDF